MTTQRLIKTAVLGLCMLLHVCPGMASGAADPYMVVDLATGSVVFEDGTAADYTNDVYKTTKMAFRKVPAGTYAVQNGTVQATMEKDYYIGVFPVTQYQYRKLCVSNPSAKTSTISGNTTDHRPVEQVSWDDLRLSTTAPTSSIPAVASNSGTFFQRLNYVTGNKYNFDLPTEVMFEIAERAGATTVYYWGNTVDASYIVCSDNSGSSTVAVGSRLPNA